MKKSFILLSVLVAGIASAQPANEAARSPKEAANTPKSSASKASDHSMTTQLSAAANGSLMVIKPDQPNEIKGAKYTYSGVAVQAVKSKEPWQLVNPLAPARYGSGSQNLHRDAITGKPDGSFNVFSISF